MYEVTSKISIHIHTHTVTPRGINPLFPDGVVVEEEDVWGGVRCNTSRERTLLFEGKTRRRSRRGGWRRRRSVAEEAKVEDGVEDLFFYSFEYGSFLGLINSQKKEKFVFKNLKHPPPDPPALIQRCFKTQFL